jgi:signal transduction histidine kinase
MFVIAAAMLGLIALLATLQYRWLGRISDSEREHLKSTLAARADAYARDFDRELTLAYMLFQFDGPLPGTPLAEEPLPVRLATRMDRWQATARYPKLIREVYVTARDADGSPRLMRFNAATRLVEPADWPAALQPIRAQLVETREEKTPGGTMVVRTISPALWEGIPALVVPSAPSPLLLFNAQARPALRPPASLSYTVILLDRQFIAGEMLPALTGHHFRAAGDDTQYQLAVLDAPGAGMIYRSTANFSPAADATADATAELFQVRPQEFPELVADVRRFTALQVPPGTAGSRQTVRTFTLPAPRAQAAGGGRAAPPSAALEHQMVFTQTAPISVMVGQGGVRAERTVVNAVAAARLSSTAKWRLMIKHPAGSLEAAVSSVRRRNLLISMGILGVLAASMVMLVASTRRAQQLARQQMEFVAAVSHELRTPLAVVRSAADNLADGVVHDEGQVRKYGELVRSEGRRLTEMVEQILELAGIHSGQRAFTQVALRIDALVDNVLRASGTLIEAAHIEVQTDIPPHLPPVWGDEAALRRVFQNLVGNAIKYGADGRWIGISARRAGGEVRVTVSDRGLGIAAADHERVFEPFYRAADVVAAQVQGAGLGLSLVRRIVEAHGGRVTVKSAKLAGSDFTVYLPAATEQAARRPAQLDADAAHAQRPS